MPPLSRQYLSTPPTGQVCGLHNWTQVLWQVSGLLLGITLSTVFFFIFFENSLLPPKPAEWPRWKHLAVYGQYFLYPMVGLVLSVLPALEAHTRLLFGRYLEYRVTEKV